MLIIFDDQRRECIKNKSGLSKVRPYTGYDDLMVQVADTFLSLQHRAGSQTTGESQTVLLGIPSREGVRVLCWKSHGRSEIYIKTWF